MTRAAALLAWLAIAPAAFADTVAGSWSFETEIERKGCTISGKMTIRPAENGINSCAFVSQETCDQSPGRHVRMDQACNMIASGKGYAIRSVVIGSLTEGYDSAFYLPDHFNVKPAGPDRMTGLWYDSNFAAPVVFWRDENTPIS